MILKLSEAPQPIFFRDPPERGTVVESQFGRDEFRHSVRGPDGEDGLLYLPADAQAQLERLDAPKASTILCAKLKRAGKNAYSFLRIEDDNAAGNRQPTRSYQDPDDYRPAPTTNGAHALAPAPQTRTQPTPIAPAAPATQLNIQSAAACMDLNRPEAKQMASAFFNAIDALAVSQQYAQQRGLNITFSAEDVRALGITAYIALTKGGKN